MSKKRTPYSKVGSKAAMRYLEIIPRNGSHYFVMDGREISRHNNIRITEAVREEILREILSLDSADSGCEQNQAEVRAVQSQAESALLQNHDNAIFSSNHCLGRRDARGRAAGE
jgi:hypothetical protein